MLERAAPVLYVLGILLLIMATRRDVMGRYVNRWWQTALGLLGLAAILATCYRLLTTLIGFWFLTFFESVLWVVPVPLTTAI